jgi:hypothetical protein
MKSPKLTHSNRLEFLLAERSLILRRSRLPLVRSSHCCVSRALVLLSNHLRSALFGGKSSCLFY